MGRCRHEWGRQVSHDWFRPTLLNRLESRGEALIRIRLSSESNGRRLCKVASGSSEVVVGSSYLGSVIICIWGKFPWCGMVLLCQSCFETYVILRRSRDWWGLLELGRCQVYLVHLSRRGSLGLLFLDDVSTEFKCRRAFINLRTQFFFGIIINLMITFMTLAGIIGHIAFKRSEWLEIRFHDRLHRGVESHRRTKYTGVSAKQLLIVGR